MENTNSEWAAVAVAKRQFVEKKAKLLEQEHEQRLFFLKEEQNLKLQILEAELTLKQNMINDYNQNRRH